MCLAGYLGLSIQFHFAGMKQKVFAVLEVQKFILVSCVNQAHTANVVPTKHVQPIAQHHHFQHTKTMNATILYLPPDFSYKISTNVVFLASICPIANFMVTMSFIHQPHRIYELQLSLKFNTRTHATQVLVQMASHPTKLHR